VRASATPCPSTAASITIAGAVQHRTVRGIGIHNTCRFEPLRPVLPVVEMQQRKLQHVGRLADAVTCPTGAWDCRPRTAVRCTAARHRAPPSCRLRAVRRDQPPPWRNRRDAWLRRSADQCRGEPRQTARGDAPAILAAKSGDVLTVSAPELWRCTRRSVPTAIRSSASRTTAR